jgi:hypothetical protein
MSENLLRQYLHEAVLAELSVDWQFVNMLMGRHDRPSMMGHGKRGANKLQKQRKAFVDDSIRIANEWIQEVEENLGMQLRPSDVEQVMRYCFRKFPGLAVNFRGNMRAAEHTLYNMLNSKFGTLIKKRKEAQKNRKRS